MTEESILESDDTGYKLIFAKRKKNSSDRNELMSLYLLKYEASRKNIIRKKYAGDYVDTDATEAMI